MSIYQSTKTLPYVYRLDHPTTGEFYIGYRSANKKPSTIDLPLYKTSSKAVKPRFGEFKWHIVAEFFDADAAYDFEQQLIFENWENELIMNESCHYKHSIRFNSSSPETRKKISEGQMGNKRGPETGRRISAALTGKLKGVKKPEWFGEKLSKATLGKPKSAEHIAAMSKATKGISRPQKQSTCPHCGRTGAVNLLTRYHFDNCKLLAACV